MVEGDGFEPSKA
ncbi:hypothetical protein VC116059_001136A, partial [Vibrio cholerae O1 str. 116059]